MNICDRVRIKADEPEYCNKHGKEGDYMGMDEEYNFSVVWFDDGTKLYFYQHELEVIECPMNKQSQCCWTLSRRFADDQTRSGR